MRQNVLFIGLFVGLLCAVLLFGGCDGAAWPEPHLGDERYDAAVFAIVYGDVPGVGDEGVFYRDVIDVDGMLTSAEKDVLVFLYNGLSTDESGLLAHAERLTEKHHEDLWVICVDGMREPSVAHLLDVDAYPEYVLVRPQGDTIAFGAHDRASFTPNDVDAWLYDLIE